MELLPPTFFARDTLAVARALLGKTFVRKLDGEVLSGRIVEVEAYHQDGDEAAHSYRGRTPRNEVMFRSGGHLYVYFTYGMHFCMNAVTEGEGVGAAVLIRAIEPLEGIETMRRLRGKKITDRDLARGPARSCQAFGVAREENGLLLDGTTVGILDADPLPDQRIAVTSRVGIKRSRELPWRFFDRESAWVSTGKPSA